jgi:hypothetical protein
MCAPPDARSIAAVYQPDMDGEDEDTGKEERTRERKEGRKRERTRKTTTKKWDGTPPTKERHLGQSTPTQSAERRSDTVHRTHEAKMSPYLSPSSAHQKRKED